MKKNTTTKLETTTNTKPKFVLRMVLDCPRCGTPGAVHEHIKDNLWSITCENPSCSDTAVCTCDDRPGFNADGTKHVWRCPACEAAAIEYAYTRMANGGV